MGFRDILPASLQEIVQNGLLDGVFEHALQPKFLYDALAEEKPWGAQLGAQAIFTRDGLIPPITTPITGNDAGVVDYGFEQYSVKMDQWGASKDTNMLLSAQALASKWLEDNNRMGVHAAQSLNLVAQQALYGAFGEGQTWVTTASTTSTALIVADATGFVNAVADLGTTGGNASEGLPGNATPTVVPVSAATPLAITVGGVANTVTGVDTATDTLTLGTAISATIGQAVVSSVSSVMFRPNGRASANQLVSGDVATLALFLNAVTRLRSMNVDPISGAYTAHVAPQTLNELFADPNFLEAYRGRWDSPAYVDFKIGSPVGDGRDSQGEFLGRFAGIDWIMNNVTPTATNIGGVTYWRPIVCGQDVLVKAPFEDMGSLISNAMAQGVADVSIINGVVRIWRAPLDRLGQVLTTSWSWVGGYTVGTDVQTGDSAIYKRAVVLEHA